MVKQKEVEMTDLSSIKKFDTLLHAACEKDDPVELERIFKEIISTAKHQTNHALITPEVLKYCNYCLENKKWKALKVFFDHRVFQTTLKPKLHDLREDLLNTASTIAIRTNEGLEPEKMQDLKRLLISFNILEKYVCDNHLRRMENYTSLIHNVWCEHVNMHIFYAAGFRVCNQDFNEVRHAFNVSYVNSITKQDVPIQFEVPGYKYTEYDLTTLKTLKQTLDLNINGCRDVMNTAFALRTLNWTIPDTRELSRSIELYYKDHPNNAPTTKQLSIRFEVAPQTQQRT